MHRLSVAVLLALAGVSGVSRSGGPPAAVGSPELERRGGELRREAVFQAGRTTTREEGMGQETPVTRDTLPNGAVRVFTTGDGLWEKGDTWRLEEEIRLGTTVRGGPDAFADVRGLAVDDLGRVWVLDTRLRKITVFDHEGRFIRKVGRRGDGPGEFQFPNGISVGPDGRIHVFDPRSHRIVVFDTAGRHLLDHRRTTSGFGYVWRGGFARAGHLYDYRGRMGIVVLDPGLTERDTIKDLPLMQESSSFAGPNRQGGRTVMPVPFRRRPPWQVGPKGWIWTTTPRRYGFVALSTNLDTMKVVEREYSPVPVSSTERATAESTIHEIFAPNADIDLSRIPVTKPAVQAFFFDDLEYLWSRPYLPGDSTGLALDIFDQEGRYLGRVSSPVKLRRTPDPVVRNGRLYGVTVDEFDVPYVVILRIEKP